MKLVKVSDLFDIKNGNGYELINMDETNQDERYSCNFISRTEKSNGVSARVELTDVEPFPANTITVAVGGSVLATFLQSEPYYTGFHIQILIPKKDYSDVEMLFYAYCIRQNKYRYNYGRQANKTLKNIEIPESMPEEWRKLSISKINTLKSNPILNQEIELNIRNWKSFNILDYFDIIGSKTTPITELLEYGSGNWPFVTTQATNNGIEGFYDYYTEEGNVLTVDSAVLGYCSYQPLQFSASDHVEKLIPKFEMNKYHAIFLVTILNKEQYRYNYGRKASQTRLKERSIKLPANSAGEPDWEYMESYIKSLPYSKSI
jgi:hypothetical protein